MRKPKRYSTLSEAETAALNLSYKTGEEYYVFENVVSRPRGEVSPRVHSTHYTLAQARRVYEDKRRGFVREDNPGTRLVLSTTKAGWSRGLHKELGDDNPCRIMFRCETTPRSYTW